ncbi:unnamed protein product [Chondrus crispus]|uniref:Uncharacterized protein n=1 Tax=Chondrus crispus TaxID=2769 RepID=R7QCW9_CHOCR|nr:unnamed protein product [Chondrus crispus]CDF36352.1 unnamed protein product [Chondrus crispus]|eukprot:XP_005716171.1 unnamed protein product [Chondrus crispus]
MQSAKLPSRFVGRSGHRRQMPDGITTRPHPTLLFVSALLGWHGKKLFARAGAHSAAASAARSGKRRRIAGKRVGERGGVAARGNCGWVCDGEGGLC